MCTIYIDSVSRMYIAPRDTLLHIFREEHSIWVFCSNLGLFHLTDFIMCVFTYRLQDNIDRLSVTSARPWMSSFAAHKPDMNIIVQ